MAYRKRLDNIEPDPFDDHPFEIEEKILKRM